MMLKDIRLSNGSTLNQGYLEVLIDGRWGKVCTNDWTIKESTVACNMLNMRGKASPWSPPMISELPTILYLESCNGSETSFKDCKNVYVRQENCSTFFIRGVSCGYPSGKYKHF
jgi:hypothetical protein